MRMRENLIDIYKTLTNSETLLRLLYYLPTNASDSPLDQSKENILSRTDKWDIIFDRIKTTIKVDDLDDDPKCRILFYAGNRRGSNANYIVANQEIVFDIFCHYKYDEVDLRLSWICDTINDLVFDEKITGIKKNQFDQGGNIKAPNGYVGYRLIYEIVSGNK